jgi:hypothetical protein
MNVHEHFRTKKAKKDYSIVKLLICNMITVLTKKVSLSDIRFPNSTIFKVKRTFLFCLFSNQAIEMEITYKNVPT